MNPPTVKRAMRARGREDLYTPAQHPRDAMRDLIGSDCPAVDESMLPVGLDGFKLRSERNHLRRRKPLPRSCEPDDHRPLTARAIAFRLLRVRRAARNLSL